MVMTTLNGFHPSTSHHTPLAHVNGHDVTMTGEEEFSMKALEDELEAIEEGVVPIGTLVQRVVQACYAELQELHETYVSLCLEGPYPSNEDVIEVFQLQTTIIANTNWRTLLSAGRGILRRFMLWLNGLATRKSSRSAWCAHRHIDVQCRVSTVSLEHHCISRGTQYSLHRCAGEVGPD